MKKLNIGILLLLSFIISTNLFAQELTQYNKKEIGIRMNGLLDFGFMYKKQKTETKYKRLRVALANLSLADFSNLRTTFSLGLAIGREKRKALNDKLKLIQGWEIIEEFNSSLMNNNLALQFSAVYQM